MILPINSNIPHKVIESDNGTSSILWLGNRRKSIRKNGKIWPKTIVKVKKKGCRNVLVSIEKSFEEDCRK